ncbi:MAG: hypothetical protein AAGA32_01705 [Pseudomonadota bacterium]
MSTPIFDRTRSRSLTVLALALLAACATRIPAEDRAALRVAGASITVVAPDGFCVDPQSVDVTRAGGRVLFGDCALLSGEASDASPISAVMTASVSAAPLPGDLSALGDFLTGPGRVTVGRGSPPEAIAILDRRTEDDILFLKIEDAGSASVPGTEPTFWRAFFETGERLIFATVTTFSTAPLSDEVQQDLLRALARRTRDANPPEPDAIAPPAGDASPA